MEEDFLTNLEMIQSLSQILEAFLRKFLPRLERSSLSLGLDLDLYRLCPDLDLGLKDERSDLRMEETSSRGKSVMSLEKDMQWVDVFRTD